MDLSGKRILIVEDEWLVALGLEDNLRSLGCVVIGPVASLGEAMDIAEATEADAAILDVNLRGEYVYPAAEILADRGIPLIFCSGFVGTMPLPERFSESARVPKPYTSRAIAQTLAATLAGSPEMEPAFHPPSGRNDAHI
ncbi:response regulator [Aquabacter spiritensis]|uniref:CheY-like chemotaxis protein n=1 Tax=Aquabacter spiritensis TaxID=933073 RepID=A0A4R3M5M0_9HYPH|nr:response regulator [Aquabacter spiritensis]TCT07549.1 CheY-like chemotaxis protein [Aquabacter spiritensis]